jgi:prepilin-type N-terminal cleavage/methylation domain-containing protein
MADFRLPEGGFTLIEILAVLSVLAITIAVVFPVSYRMAEKFDRYIAGYQEVQDRKQLAFEDFITDRSLRPPPGE